MFDPTCHTPDHAAPIAARRPAPRRTLAIAGRDHPQRETIERFVAAVYRARFGARITQWSPLLVALCVDGRLAAAAGYRRATEPLYLERYLDEPIETAVAARVGVAVARATLVEIGHFAATRHGEGRRLMTLLARHLLSAGACYAVTTATRELRLMYDRLGMLAWWLADARPDALGATAQDWGRYYEHAPAVMAGPIARNLAILERGAHRLLAGAGDLARATGPGPNA